MEDNRETNLQTALMVLSGTLTCILVGLISYGNGIFTPGTPSFQFVIFGLVLSLAVSVVKRHSTKVYITTSMIVLIGLFIFTFGLRRLALFPIVRDLIRCVCLIVAVYVVSKVNQMKSLRVRPVNEMLLWTWASLLAYLASSGILFFIISPERFHSFFRMQLLVGLLVGVGVATGVEMCQYLLSRQQR
jgi:cation transport ATPase